MGGRPWSRHLLPADGNPSSREEEYSLSRAALVRPDTEVWGAQGGAAAGAGARSPQIGDAGFVAAGIAARPPCLPGVTVTGAGGAGLGWGLPAPRAGGRGDVTHADDADTQCVTWRAGASVRRPVTRASVREGPSGLSA